MAPVPCVGGPLGAVFVPVWLGGSLGAVVSLVRRALGVVPAAPVAPAAPAAPRRRSRRAAA